MTGGNCPYCAHLRPRGEPGAPRTCAAYPAGIPDGIVLGEVEHLKPYRGDHGIQFSPVPGFEWVAQKEAVDA